MKATFYKKLVTGKKFTYWCLVIFLVASHIVFGLRTVSLGSELSELEAEERVLKSQIKDINTNLANITSLTKVKENSTNLGFMKPQSTVYISESEFVARLPF